MRALVKRPDGPGLSLEDVPEPGPGEVRVKVLKTAICGTDLHIYRWDDWARATVPAPMIIGHEFVGVVDRPGPGVSDIPPGELVCGEGHIVCGPGGEHLAGGSAGTAGGAGLFRSLRQRRSYRPPVASARGGRADHRRRADRGDGRRGRAPCGCTAHRGGRTERVSTRPGVAHGRQPRGGSARDRPQDRHGRPRHEGGVRHRPRNIGRPQRVKGGGAVVCHGGRIALLGLLPGDAPIDWRAVIFNMLTLRGIYGREMFETWYLMTSMVLSGLDIRPVITHRFRWSDYEAAFETIASGRSGKVPFDWADAGSVTD